MTHSMPVLLTLPKRPSPAFPDAPEPTLARLIALWGEVVEPVHLHGDGDWEDWVESAYRLLAAVDTFGRENVWVRTFDTVRNAATLATPTFDIARIPDLGMVPGRHGADRGEAARLASGYMSSATFATHAGRHVEVADIGTGDDRDIDAAVARAYAAGVERVLVKSREPKAFFVEVPQGVPVMSAVDDAGGWVLVRLEGQRGAALVQEWVPMRFEYRTFVVGGDVVTGAGTVLEHTPLDNTGEAFDPLMREWRDDAARDRGGAVVERRDVRDELVAFARSVATAFALERPEMSEYVLDVALGPHGPLVVEVNSLSNSGYFACQPHAVFAALSEHLGVHREVDLTQ